MPPAPPPASSVLRPTAESAVSIGTSPSRDGRRVRSGGAEYARSACSVSLVSRPFQTRSQIASTVSCGKPPPVASCSGPKNDAPWRCRCATSCASRPVSPSLRLPPQHIRRQQRRHVIGQIQRDAAVALAERLHADPRHFAGGRAACRASPASSRCTRAASTSDSSTDAAIGTPCSCSITSSRPSSPWRWPRQPVPVHEEAAERRRLNRLDLLPQPRQRSLPHRAQHLGVAPLAAAAAGTEFAVDHPASGQQPRQRRIDHREAQAQARRRRPCS